MGLITPKRLKENEEFMWRLADRQLDVVLPAGQCEFIDDFAQPYTLLVIADLLGVPEADHESLLRRSGVGRRILGQAGEDEGRPDHPLDFLYGYFSERIEQLRNSPRGDVLTGMARATFPDGSIPEPVDVARIAANLFSAGQETTVRLLSTALRLICDQPGLQQRLRENRELIPRFIEETLRLESPIKGAFRLALKTTTLGGVEIGAGTAVMLLHGATGRDPRQFECPHELRIDRPNVRQHISFGAGIHTCPGAPLARAEGRVVIERLFDRTTEIRVSEAAHGPASARRYDYLPTYMIHGLRQLNLEFDWRGGLSCLRLPSAYVRPGPDAEHGDRLGDRLDELVLKWPIQTKANLRVWALRPSPVSTSVVASSCTARRASARAVNAAAAFSRLHVTFW
jgi:cytochrome P450